MIQKRLHDKEKEIQGLKKQTSSLLNRAWEKGYVAGFDDGYETGKQAEKQQCKWIPVSVRLPEGKIDPMTNDFELVLCSTVWEVVRPYKFGKPKGHSKAHFWSGGGIMDDYVIAWQPLPEAYKEAENE